MINPALTETDIFAARVGLCAARPVCARRFLELMPGVQTTDPWIASLEIAPSSHRHFSSQRSQYKMLISEGCHDSHGPMDSRRPS
jgi:hypothetical protein